MIVMCIGSIYIYMYTCTYYVDQLIVCIGVLVCVYIHVH